MDYTLQIISYVGLLNSAYTTFISLILDYFLYLLYLTIDCNFQDNAVVSFKRACIIFSSEPEPVSELTIIICNYSKQHYVQLFQNLCDDIHMFINCLDSCIFGTSQGR